MPKALDKPRIWGYARVSKADGRVIRSATHTSDASSEPSIKRQTDGIFDKAAALAAELDCTIGTVFNDGTSGVDVGFDERDGYQKLIRAIQPGDHLVVWRLSRIDRSPFRLYRACEYLVDHRVHIHSYGDTHGELDLSTAMGRATLAIMAVVNDLFVENLRTATKEALQWRKDNGLAYGQHPGLGKRRVYSKHGKVVAKGPRDDKDIVRTDVWDEKECDLIREIKRRKDAGDSFYEIGKDFEARGETSWDGLLWVTYSKDRQGRRKKRISVNRIRRCYNAYEEMLKEKKDLQDLHLEQI